jgi:hypothetical protein
VASASSLRFEAQTQEQAIAEGKATLTKRQGQLDAWAFVREGLMPEGTGKVDVLTVDAWARGMTRPITFVQKFSPYSSGAFRIKGDAIVVVDGKVVAGAEATGLVKGCTKACRSTRKLGSSGTAGVVSDTSPRVRAAHDRSAY